MDSVSPGIGQLGCLRNRIGPTDRCSHDAAAIDRKGERDWCPHGALGHADRMPVAHHIEFHRVGLIGEDLGPYTLAVAVSGVGWAGRVTEGDMRAGNVTACEIPAFEQHPTGDHMCMPGDRHFELPGAAIACVAAESPIALGKTWCADACDDEENRDDPEQGSIEPYRHTTPRCRWLSFV